MSKILSTNFAGVNFKNPVSTSSGCFGYGLDYVDYFDPNDLGGLSLTGITMEYRRGNLGVRIAETSSGILNCVGLENEGVEAFKNEILPELESKLNTNMISNVNGSTVDDYINLTKQLCEIDSIDILEINVSCPNVKNGGMAFGANPEMLRTVTKEVKKVCTKPFIIKLSPNVTNIVEMAQIVEAEGANGISMINTLLGMSIDINSKKPLLGNTFGGLSGKAVKPIALRMIYQVSNAVSIPIIGMGGISSVNDALEFIMAGASIVSVGTHLFENPMLPVEIVKGLEQYCIKNKIENISELVGTAHSDDGAAYRKRLEQLK